MHREPTRRRYSTRRPTHRHPTPSSPTQRRCQSPKPLIAAVIRWSPHQGDLSLVVSALAILPLGTSYDLDGDGDPDNKVAAIGSISQSYIDDGLAAGTMVLPVEIFDRDPDPDACVKLGLYTGACATPGCDLTDATPDTVTIDPTSLGAGDVPLSRLRSMSTTAAGAVTALRGVIRLDIPINEIDHLPMPITVQYADGMFTATGPTAQLTGLRFGGTMQAFRLETVEMPVIEEIGVMPGDTMLDGIFANLLGPLLALPQSPFQTGCRTADIDLDDDGLESFCDSDPDDAIHAGRHLHRWRRQRRPRRRRRRRGVHRHAGRHRAAVPRRDLRRVCPHREPRGDQP